MTRVVAQTPLMGQSLDTFQKATKGLILSLKSPADFMYRIFSGKMQGWHAVTEQLLHNIRAIYIFLFSK